MRKCKIMLYICVFVCMCCYARVFYYFFCVQVLYRVQDIPAIFQIGMFGHQQTLSHDSAGQLDSKKNRED